MRGEREREDGERLARIADQRRRGDHEESGRQRDIEADAGLRFMRDREADVCAGRQREQQRRQLREAQLGDEAIAAS